MATTAVCWPLMPRPPKQHAPVKFGEPFNPKSVEGVRAARQEAFENRRAEKMLKELAVKRLAGRPLRVRLWEKLSRVVARSKWPVVTKASSRRPKN